jgi:predicted dehydrogenase
MGSVESNGGKNGNSTDHTLPGTTKILRVGIIGIGEVAQSIHLPTLALLSHLFTVVAICDISADALAHCSKKFHVPRIYESDEQLCADPEVDVVFILTSDEFHADQAVLALKHKKHVLVEKPVSLSIAAAQRMQGAEKESQGKVFVAYMRRYSGALQTFLAELATVPREEIKFARVRDIIGPNAFFVDQSGTFTRKFTDYLANAMAARTQTAEKLLKEVYPNHTEITPLMTRFCRFLGGLGSHDLSVMREVLGMPKRCTGVSMHPPFFTATFEYENFAVCYESGIDKVPKFNVHLQVYNTNKTLKLEYNTSYIKGFPVKVVVDEKTATGGYQTREILTT